MKLSNKILVGFFGLAFIYLTAVFAEIRLRGTPNIIDDTNSIAETVDLSGIAYIILEDLDKDINVIGSDRPRIEVRSLSGDLLKKVKYRISGDTLILSQLQSEGIKTIKVSIFITKTGLKGITVNSATAIVKGLEQNLLYISQSAGRIWMSDNAIDKIRMKASDKSYLDISGTDLDTLSANIDQSVAHIASPVGILEGSMKNNSFLRVSNVDDIDFKKDKSSTLHLYQ